jgi:hypothetical protein
MYFMRTFGYSCSGRTKEKIMRELRIPKITELTEEPERIRDRMRSDNIPRKIVKHQQK